jgi:hypothetical protein
LAKKRQPVELWKKVSNYQTVNAMTLTPEQEEKLR